MHTGVHVIITENASLELGDGGYTNRHSKIKCFDKIKIGDDVVSSENVTIWDSDAHEIIGLEKTKPVIIIGNHVWIGTNTIKFKGVTIGAGAVIAAGALINRDVPPRSLAGGIPAKILKQNIEWQR
ncbi:MAG: hypothetical protein AAGU19_12905 [Prolixibacteraceae bacterium]